MQHYGNTQLEPTLLLQQRNSLLILRKIYYGVNNNIFIPLITTYKFSISSNYVIMSGIW